MRSRRMAAAALAAALGVTACSGGPAVDPDGVVRVAITEPGELWPADTDDPAGLQVLSALFAPLVGIDEQGQPYEVAARSVEPDDDARVWTVTLREGATFHDGEPVTSDSYLAAWNFAAHADYGQRGSHLFRHIDGYDQVNPPGGRRPTADQLAGLQRVDEHTFTVTLAEPFRDFRAMLGYPAFAPLPPAAFTGDGAPDPDFGAAPVGNGPFRVAGRDTDTGAVTLERYESYQGPAAARTGGVQFVVYDDLHDAYPDLINGDLDVIADIPARHRTAAATDLGDRYLREPAPDFQFLAFDPRHEELADPDVRRAISLALDRDELFAGGTAARAFAPPVVPGAREDTCGDACTLDPETARDLYTRAGGPPRLQITYNEDGGHSDWIATACAQLRDHLQVECTTSGEPALSDVLSRVNAGDGVGVFRLGWAMDYPSLENYLGPLYTTTGSSNWHGYSNAEFDALVAQGRAAGSPDEAIAAYQAAEDLLARDLPVIPLSFGRHHAGHSEAVRGVHLTQFGVDLTRVEVLDRK